MRSIWVLAVALAACGRIHFDPVADGAASELPCLQWSAFNAPSRIEELSSAGVDSSASISPDGLELTYSSDRAGTRDLYLSSRTTTTSRWSAPTLLAGFGTSAGVEDEPTLSSDGLAMYFGKSMLSRAARGSQNEPFGRVDMVPLSPDVVADGFELSRDDLHLYFTNGQFFVMDRAVRTDVFSTYTALPLTIPDGSSPGFPTLSADELEIFVSTSDGPHDIWTSRRDTRTSPFAPMTRSDELSSTSEDWDPELSFDGTTMYLASDRIGALSIDLFVATRTCLRR